MCKFKMLKLLSYVCFLCVVKMGSNFVQRDEGSPCHQLGLSGTCKRVTNCTVAADALMKRQRHNLQRCGFTGNEEVVCCPNLSERSPLTETTTLDPRVIWAENSNKRKCQIMCEKIYKEHNIKPEIEFHVLNGEDAYIGEFPHMAAIGYLEGDSIQWKQCGASLISPRYLLTAAHCIVCRECKPQTVRLGVIDIRDEPSAQDINIKGFNVSNYNYTTKHNDIALIELVEEVKMSKTIYPACLYTKSDDPIGLKVTGWGQTDQSEQSRSDILQSATLDAVPVDKCNTTLTTRNKSSAKIIISTQICAQSNKSDSCYGDSGGPLQLRKKEGGFDIVGIISYGISCGSNAPAVYTRVSAYLDWIEEIVWPT